MPSPRASVDHAVFVGRRHGLVPALLLGLLLTLASCGSSEEEAKAGAPSKDTVACRHQWKALEDEVGDRASRREPSALAPRWNSVAATTSYYANGAQAADCDTALNAQQKAMDDLTAFGARLRPYDMELRLRLVKPGAEQYAARPRPKPGPAPREKNKREQAALISAVLRNTFVAERMPACTWLGVSSLALDELLIEIEATAVSDAE